jgi:hypothetical protein
LTADFFDSVHPLPEVYIYLFLGSLLSNFVFRKLCFPFSLVTLVTRSRAGAPISPLTPPSSRGRAPFG